jgi:hypothetical protein
MLRRARMGGMQRVWLGVVGLVPEVSLIGLLLLGVGPDRLWLLVVDAVALLCDVGLVGLLIHYVGVYHTDNYCSSVLWSDYCRLGLG